MLERDLKPAVCEWLRADDHLVTAEFHLPHWHPVDLYGVRFGPRLTRRIPVAEHGIAVELKLTRITEVLQQAIRNQPYCHLSYAAMPLSSVSRMQPRTVARFREAGVGLLQVDGSTVTVVIHPITKGHISPWLSKKLWRRVLRDRRLGRKYV
jgi:hypothetical protein